MYAAVILLVFMCLTATTHADHHHHPCHAPNMTGFMTVTNLKGEVRAIGAFTYDSTAKKLRFRSNESTPINTSLHLDLLVFFEEGILYEIDSKNQSCEKKKLQCNLHPLDIPDDATFMATMTFGSPSVEGEGIKLNLWTGSMRDTKGKYTMSTTMGCLPLSALYYTGSTTFCISNLHVIFVSLPHSHVDIESEIKEPELLLVPSFCQGLSVEETPEGTVNSFLSEFM
ncbi:ependymin isoform X2 [Acanthochromis polyacanthus]|uniref:ependymin isoform X1 n=1 Tax=Acanthochromis polyacanthus TaxID=80966 RepID=UPI0022340AB3|nr:ependymin isoform X1 [Acanthochromis polyacanthus]XP_051793405.1 ependymin isoform X2 [Acanthochromis polyacanthus]